MSEKMICVSVYESGINCIHRSPQGPGRSLCTMNGEMEQVLEKECENCSMGVKLKRAVEVMAQASCELFVGNDWEQMTEEQKKPFMEEAAIMLKALIEECEGW